MKTIKLSLKFKYVLINLPESGMGYQLVKVYLKNGEVLNNHKVLNCESLLLNNDEYFTVNDIEKIELETK